MEKNEVLAQILDAYVADVGPSPDILAALTQFCGYADTWFSQNNVVGVGQSAEGVSLRFSDGQERVLFAAAATNIPDAVTPAINITGSSAGGVRNATPMADTSLNITG